MDILQFCETVKNKSLQSKHIVLFQLIFLSRFTIKRRTTAVAVANDQWKHGRLIQFPNKVLLISV